MKPYLVKTPKLVPWIFPHRFWAFSRKEPKVYLTFDDGPIPEITPWVLDMLQKHDAKATFFCIGDNIKKHPGIFKDVIQHGHTIGNHTYHHVKGTETGLQKYIDEVALCDYEMLKQAHHDTKSNYKLFRPPYGKMTAKQAVSLRKKGYQLIMWDVLSGDFDAAISAEKCLQNVLKNIRPGSIVVFHDSQKAAAKLHYVLPKVLQYIKNKKWVSSAIE